MKLVWKNSNKLKRSGKYRNKNSYLTEEYRNSQRERTINLWKNQEYREKVIKAMSKPKNIKKERKYKSSKTMYCCSRQYFLYKKYLYRND